MTFDEKSTRTFAEQRDRDAAPFFAGRAEEIGRFEQALDEKTSHPGGQAVFRIYKVRPGAARRRCSSVSRRSSRTPHSCPSAART